MTTNIPSSIQTGIDTLLAPYGYSLQQLLEQNQKEAPGKQESWLNRKEAAEFAKVSPDTIDNWCRAGNLSCAKLNPAKCGRVLIRKSSLEKFILRKCRKPAL